MSSKPSCTVAFCELYSRSTPNNYAELTTSYSADASVAQTKSCGPCHFLSRNPRKNKLRKHRDHGDQATDYFCNFEARTVKGRLPNTHNIWRDKGDGGCNYLQRETKTLDPFCFVEDIKCHIKQDGYITTAVERVAEWPASVEVEAKNIRS